MCEVVTISTQNILKKAGCKIILGWVEKSEIVTHIRLLLKLIPQIIIPQIKK
jgi:hypothetical protein